MGGTKRIRGTVSIVATETSRRLYPSTIEGRSDSIRGTTVEAVLEDLKIVVDKLGHFPSRLEYKEHGKCFHTMIVRLHGLQGLAKLLGMTGPSPGMKKRKIEQSNMAYRCFNNELCVNTPPTKVVLKQTYCRACKIERDWSTFRGDYND